MHMTDYLIRKYKKNDKEKIFHLVKAVWGEAIAKKTARRWDWEFETNPNNPPDGPIILVCEQGNNIIGMICGLSALIKVNEKLITALWTVDVMVHPKYRGTIGFRLIKRMLYEEPYLHIGFPIHPNLWRRIGTSDLFELYSHIKIINAKNILNKKFRNKAIPVLVDLLWRGFCKIAFFYPPIFRKEIVTAKIDIFNDEIDKFWGNASKDYKTIIVRDRKYLNWRFVNCPDKEYMAYTAKRKGEILGYIVFRHEMKNALRYGYIVDFLTKPNDKRTFQCLIQKATETLQEMKVDIIVCTIESHSGVHMKVLKRAGFVFKRPVTTGVFLNSSAYVKKEDLMKRDSWFVTRGDSDMDIT